MKRSKSKPGQMTAEDAALSARLDALPQPSWIASSAAFKTHEQRVAAWYRQLDKQDQQRNDAARICYCGAANVHDQHTAICWARPMPLFPFERSGFKAAPKPLRYKTISAPARGRFAGGTANVLPYAHPLFGGSGKWEDDA